MINHDRLKIVLNPERFTDMSGKMAAIVGYMLGEYFTEPHFDEMIITSDGCVLARLHGDCGCNEFIGDEEDLNTNWNNLIHIPELNLTPEEISYLESLPDTMIRRF
jgi:hypothetical protein